MDEQALTEALVNRVDLLMKADKDVELQAVLYEMCRRDPVFWFNNFCYTFDPRTRSPEMPFLLYPFQEYCIREWYKNIEEQKDFGIEKSRDMGVSWMLMLLFQYCWIFRPGWNFHCGSKKEAEVDTGVIDPSTLFGKFRFNLRKLPPWMRPKVREKMLTLQNEDNGNILTGESANPGFGRSRRFRAILFDEFAFWTEADVVYGGCSATTNCRIINSTPFGEDNKFAKLMNDPSNELLVPPIDTETKELITDVQI